MGFERGTTFCFKRDRRNALCLLRNLCGEALLQRIEAVSRCLSGGSVSTVTFTD